MQLSMESVGISAFVVEVIKADKQEDTDRKYWDMYLHKSDGKLSFGEWKQLQIQRQSDKEISKAKLEKAISDSFEMFNSFNI